MGRPIRLLEGSDRCGEVFARRTLDGLAYLEQNSPGEYAVIQWLADRDGQPVIAEAAGDEAYSDLGRVAASTGVPTVVGWLNHERQWRGSDVDPMLQERKNDVMTLYTSSDPNDVRAILQKYGIDYVVLGPRERLRFGQSDVAGVGDFLEQAFPEDGSQAEAVVYRVRPETLVEAPSE